jgi:hypothetical protein
MSLKKLLGLEAFPLRDSEIMKRIIEAKRNNIEMIEFSSETKKVRVNITKLSSDGLMRDHQDYYSAK